MAPSTSSAPEPRWEATNGWCMVADMAQLHLEVLVEPFRENEPGPHVHAVLDALEQAGLEPDMGPFATTVSGSRDAIADAVAALVRAGVGAGASALQLRIEVTDDA